MDGFRAYAILGVVFLHVLGMAGASLDGSIWGIVVWGAFGGILDVFFIATGFLLFLPIIRRGGSVGGLGRYALARGARLLPGYWLCLVVLLVLLVLFPPFDAEDYLGIGALPGLKEILVNFTGTQMPVRMLNPGLPSGFGVDGPVWMISIILGFYVLLPMVARGYYRHPLIGLVIAAAISFAWKEAAVHTSIFEWIEGGIAQPWVVELIAVDQLPGWLFSFALGMTGAGVYLRLRDSDLPKVRIERAAVWIGGAALAAVLVCAYLYGDLARDAGETIGGSSARTSPLLGLAYSASRAALMGAIVLGPLWMSRPFLGRTQSFLSERSFGVYLIHIPVGIWVGTLLLGLPQTGTVPVILLWLGVVLAVSLAYAQVTLRLVERPARRWARRYRAEPATTRPPERVASVPALPVTRV
jgi:peptidoglycan/LPS O-acetylase OafA/YrhL